MNYIVFDLEWNQPIGANAHHKRLLSFEVIEIGAVKLNDAFEAIGVFDEYIKPTVYKKLNYHTKDMLGISMKDLENGRRFTQVAKSFLGWCGEDCMFCSWGTQDLSELQKNMSYYGMKPLSDGPIPYIDLQKVFSSYIKDEKSYSLETAVDILEVSKDIPFHRAYADAYYTSKLMKHMAEEKPDILSYGKSYDLYHLPKDDKHMICEFSGDQYYMLTPAYEDREVIKTNKKLLAMTCYKCNGRSLRPKIRWFSSNSKNYFGATYCMIHGNIKGMVRIRHTDDDKYYMEKFLTYTDSHQIEKIREKKQELVKRKEEAKKEALKKEKEISKEETDSNQDI